ncbi:MAG: sugar transferase [Flavobacteriaceae bacterium]|nr:sugar transferase [Flavobacteriaceae bacterium]
MYNSFMKRLFDFVVSFFLLALLFPFLIVVTILLIFQNKGKPFFFQERPGKNQKPFKIIKFKTMTDEKDSLGNLLPDVERMTKLGRVIRKLSIDELPQLINVLKGDMSLVGPRPLLFKYMPLYSEEQLRRHEVRPGITGWAQVNGRNSISWTKKFELDIEYVNNVTLLFDIKILWLTVLKVLKREGVNQSVSRPMQPFNGEN